MGFVNKKWFLYGIIFYCVGCAHSESVDDYVLKHPQLSPEITIALRSNNIINGMSQEEVKLLWGDPKFIEHGRIEKESGKIEKERWVYRGNSSPKKEKEDEAYSPDSAFPQGIGFVIPFHYQAREVRIDFDMGKVYRIQEILEF